MKMATLIPVDNSITSDLTLEKVIAFKDRFAAGVTLLHVVDTDKLAYRMIPDFQLDMIKEKAGESGQHLLDSKVAILEAAGFTVQARLEFGTPRQVICNIATNEKFQLLVIGRHEGTDEIRDVLFGSVANYVLHNIACPVLLF